MVSGPCERCGAPVVRCKGLCARCYFARRYERPPAPAAGAGVRGRALERAWDSRQLLVALMAEPPAPAWEMRSWTTRSACRERRDLPWEGRQVTAEMRAICDGCPVRAECLAEALEDRKVDGVWAGTTPTQRRRLRQPSGHR